MLWLQQAQPPNLLLHAAWAWSKAHYFYCIKIRALYRTSLMFLWELKNAIISQNLRGLCVIKNPPTMASTSSATKSSITRCLSLSKAASKKPHNFITSSPRKIPLHSGFDKLSHQFFYYTLPEPVEGSIKKTSKLHHLITSSPRKIPHTVTSTSSATNSFITRCLSLSKARSYSSLWFRLRSATNSFIKRCLRVVEGTLFLLH